LSNFKLAGDFPNRSGFMMRKQKSRNQYGALPVSMRDGNLYVMLVTSRETRRWIIPKGWPEKRLAPHALAAREAYEEAGLVGRIEKRPIGRYRYDKRLKSDKMVPCVVDVYLLNVENELDDWPEKAERERRWMLPTQAAELVSEDDLANLLLTLSATNH
jgi:8-oxo-dGTP pyrophosphatase MutT (NUDIX family)